MTTKFEHSIINPLTRNNTPHYYQKPSPMDRFLESQNIESMRKKMLMQEQLFKHQVQELHRLYNQQRKVMQEIENGLKQQKETRDITKSEFTSIRHQIEAESKISERIEYANERTPIKIDLESTPSSSTHRFEDHHALKRADDEVEVELTLSIGHCTGRRRSKSAEIQGSDEVQQVASSSSTSVYQETRRPHWLLQDLSLNRT
ncbi:hypothetical protein AAHA92_17028 [Salvia divinorum]|uniref:Uncharacterized protein n=1 Tax=Salvia divinorum TaxID=28513 RepID=A0ABD1GXG6_SALDI